jgi:hypothetical protein
MATRVALFTRILPAIGAVATLLIIVCATMSTGTLTVVSNSSPPRPSGNSGLVADFWTVCTVESAYCYTPSGVNETIPFNSTFKQIYTNLTEKTTGACAGQQQPRFGTIIQDYVSGDLVWQQFMSVNNSTSVSNRSAGEWDATMNLVILHGLGSTYTYVERISVNQDNGSKGIRWQFTCPGQDDCGGGTGGSGPGLVIYSGFINHATGSGPCSGTSPSQYLWDSVCFDHTGATIAYHHPDRLYYSIIPTYNYYVNGNQLYHFQVGTAFSQYIVPLGCIGIGAGIGAVIGANGGPVGAAAGAITGAIVSGVLCGAGAYTYWDEDQCVWFWLNNGFVNAFSNVPWYIAYFGGPTAVEIWIAAQLNYLRIGNGDVVNLAGISGP